MLIQEATPELVREWKAIYAQYRPKLQPNRKTGEEVVSYLKSQYPVQEIADESWRQLIVDQVLSHDFDFEKLPTGKMPTAVVFVVLHTGTGRQLYQMQDDVFQGQEIYVGIELETGYLHVEGNSELWDVLYAYRGLDEQDLNNYFLVAQYITCLQKFHQLDQVLSREQ